jgi:N-acyl-D-amino-acid deacylase
VLSFETNLPFDQLPGWAKIRKQSLDVQRAALTDPAQRARLVDEALHSEYAPGLGAEPKPPVWELMQVIDSPSGDYPTVSALAAKRRTTPVDVVIDLSLEKNFRQFFMQPSSNLDEKMLLELLRHQRTVIALSDSGAHVSQILDTSIPTHFLAKWVRRDEAFTWEEGIRKLTSDPAALMGFTDRGMLRVGNIADITVFDPATIGPGMVEAADDLPAGGRRLKQKASGLAATVVGGTPLLRAGEHTGVFPGRLIRGPLADARF